MTEYFKIDERAWPRVRINIADVPVPDEALLRSVEQLGAIAKRGERYTLLFDARGAKPLGAQQRKLLADASVPTAPYAARNCAGSAIVVSNMVLAGIVTALHWLKPTDYPEKVFSSLEEAEAWLDEQLRAPV
ncbi:MAG: hypothetical protein KC593_06310 [Myxococcales bacterium]|nr:hypothetical protein [Myxococcales bacterium]